MHIMLCIALDLLLLCDVRGPGADDDGSSSSGSSTDVDTAA